VRDCVDFQAIAHEVRSCRLFPEEIIRLGFACRSVPFMLDPYCLPGSCDLAAIFLIKEPPHHCLLAAIRLNYPIQIIH